MKEIKVTDKYTGEIIATLHVDSREELKEKIKKAHISWPRVKKLERSEKIDIIREIGRKLRNRRKEIIEMLIREAGQPRKYAENFEYKNSYLATQFYDYMLDLIEDREIEAMTGRNILICEPVGVVATMTPRNAPLILSLHSLLSSFGAGNPTILKPSTTTPLTARILYEIAVETMPEETVQYTTTPGEQAAWEFIENPYVAALIVYSSSHIGKDNIIKYGKYLEKEKKKLLGGFLIGGKLMKYIPELAGNDPLIVMENVDVEKIAKWATTIAFSNAGQMCISAKRILIQDSIYEEFTEHLVEEVSKLKVGDPRDPDTDIGPIGTKRTLDISEAQLKDALKKGGKILCGGERNDPFYNPTLVELDGRKILKQEWNEKPFLWREECFAPIRSVVSFSNIEEAVRLANDSKYALRCVIYGSQEECIKLSRMIDAGVVVINENPLYADIFMPFGGYKDSGVSGAKYLIEELVNRKIIHLG